MVQKTMIIVAAKHNEWLNIVLSFGCKPEIAEDIVQEMYIKIQLKLEKGLDIIIHFTTLTTELKTNLKNYYEGKI